LPPDPGSNDIASLLPMDLGTKVAAELDQMREDLEDIGVSLCLDDEIMQRCMIYLQRLDELGQRANWLAELVRSKDPESRVNDITLNSLAERLRA
jgi:hypothetical protein